jgi:hypothetical protein
MKNLLNYFPSWTSVRTFFNVFYYVAILIFLIKKIIMMTFYDYIITTNDIFTGIAFLAFYIFDVHDDLKKIKK